MKRILIGLGLLAIGLASPAQACNLCRTKADRNAKSFHEHLAKAHLVVTASYVSSSVQGLQGKLVVKIDKVLRASPASLAKRQTIVIPTIFEPEDPKNPPQFLVFCSSEKGKLTILDALEIRTPELVDYVQAILKLDARNRVDALQFYFRYLDSSNVFVAKDAFLEFSKATDSEVGAVAPKLSPDRLRKLLANPQTPADRLSLYTFLLGACGDDSDAAWLRALVEKPAMHLTPALDGALAGYIQAKPTEGWDLLYSVLRDTKRSYHDRFAGLATLRFYHGWKGKETSREVLRGMAILLNQEDIAFDAISTLRQWKVWDLTAEILAQAGKKTHQAPVMQGAILRYALRCPNEEAKEFVRNHPDPKLVEELRSSIGEEEKEGTDPLEQLFSNGEVAPVNDGPEPESKPTDSAEAPPGGANPGTMDKLPQSLAIFGTAVLVLGAVAMGIFWVMRTPQPKES